MKNLSTLVFLFLSPLLSWASCDSVKHLSVDQWDVLKASYDYGEAHNLSYTLAAIAWKESGAGKWKINLQDPSASVFHISIKNALTYLNIEDTPFNRNRVAATLIEDFDLAASFAVTTLQYWGEVHQNNWRLAVASYNAGWNVDAGEGYAEDIANRVEVLKSCQWRDI